MQGLQPNPRRKVKIRTCADYKPPEFIKIKIESDREFLDRIAPKFEPKGYGAFRSELEMQLYSRLRAATA